MFGTKCHGNNHSPRPFPPWFWFGGPGRGPVPSAPASRPGRPSDGRPSGAGLRQGGGCAPQPGRVLGRNSSVCRGPECRLYLVGPRPRGSGEQRATDPALAGVAVPAGLFFTSTPCRQPRHSPPTPSLGPPPAQAQGREGGCWGLGRAASPGGASGLSVYFSGKWVDNAGT